MNTFTVQINITPWCDNILPVRVKKKVTPDLTKNSVLQNEREKEKKLIEIITSDVVEDLKHKISIYKKLK